MIGRALRYARTIRHLRGRQVLALLAARVRGPSRTPPEAGLAVPSGSLEALATECLSWGYPLDPARMTRLAGDARQRVFEFAGVRKSFDDVDWRMENVTPLWTYQFHYLESLEALAWQWQESHDPSSIATLTAILETWDERSRGGVGWDPYPTSVRVTHWSTALLLCGNELPAATRERAFASLHAQLAVLSRNLEWHLLGNHLLANLCALSRGALLFDQAAAPWRARARALYQHELHAQVLRDGLHQERTPTYHAMALRGAIEEALLRRASGGVVAEDERERFRLMLRADSLLRKPDNGARMLNDTTTSETPSRSFLERIGTRVLARAPAPEHGAFWLRDAGYAGIKDPDASCVVDACPAEPAWQPGHAHNDALSFELDVWGIPVIVDSGLHGYDGDALREYVRSTRAHNTVTIGGREQAELWGTFRMARRWRVREATTIPDATARFAFRAAISPFWSSRVRHARDFRLRAGMFSVEDTIEGAAGLPAESYVHLHPDLSASVDGSTVLVSGAGRGVARLEFAGFDQVRIVSGQDDPRQGWSCPDFGVKIAAPVIIAVVTKLSAAQRFGFTVRWK